MSNSLISYQNKVENPFIIVKIGEYTFGHCEPYNKSRLKTIVTYPNFLTGLNIRKINGAINTYIIRMVYAITQNDDPNMLERVFSSISDSRKIYITYGDWSLPQYVYKDEEAMLTEISSNVDFNNSKIEYTLKATSVALSMSAGIEPFPAKREKPSTEIKRLIKSEQYGLKRIFTGMANLDDSQLNQLIASDDQVVELKAQSCTPLDYINYLVSCMTFKDEKLNTDLKESRYYWTSFDDIGNEYGGPYFKVIKVTANAKYNLAYNAYQIDVGYPSGNFVSSFTLNNNASWAILYKHSKAVDLPSYTYDIDEHGNTIATYSPAVTTSSKYGTTVEYSKDWWSKMTQYPISAKITIK